MATKLHDAILESCAKEGTSPSAWAISVGLATSTMTTLKQGKRPSDDTLRKIATGWESPLSGIRCIQAHAEDEIHRAGLTNDQISVVAHGDVLPDDTIESALATLNHYMLKRADLRASLIELARVLPTSTLESQVESRTKVIAGKMSNKATKRPA